MYSDANRELKNLGNGLWAWIQGDGSWGWSNSGLIEGDDGQVLMVDTLFTGRLTEDMLRAYRDAVPAAAEIDILVNTHSNGDHTFGNHLVGGARIVASEACRKEMEERPAPVFKEMARDPQAFGEVGRFIHETMGVRFDFSDIEHRPPSETFTGTKTLELGGRRVALTELGPAHTRGDIIVHVPDARTVYTGDILFSGGHPIIWAGPIGNWIAACDHILSLDVDTVVPGHGPVGDKAAVRELQSYLEMIRDQAQACYEAGLSWEDASWEVGYAAFDSWLDRERVVANVANVYRELSGGVVNPTTPEIMHQMLRYRNGAPCPHDTPCGCHAKGGSRA
jgi:glyoxylase-like metal-dependent hydrolase (beta-lactamase superfamily II)